MKNFFSSDRAKWIFLIGLVAISAGFAAKNVISYPAECIPGASTEEVGDDKPTYNQATAASTALLRSLTTEKEETKETLAYLNEHGLPALCRVLLNANEFLFMQ